MGQFSRPVARFFGADCGVVWLVWGLWFFDVGVVGCLYLPLEHEACYLAPLWFGSYEWINVYYMGVLFHLISSKGRGSRKWNRREAAVVGIGRVYLGTP